MTSSVKSRTRPDLNPAKQVLALRAMFPTSRVKLGPNRLTWVGTLQPSPLSLEYTVKIKYALGKAPRVTVLDPLLEPPPGGRLRHVYPGDELCLHMHHQWTGDLLIARTTVPWTSEWLLHHELLLATGEWLGGGHEPPLASSRSSKSRE